MPAGLEYLFWSVLCLIGATTWVIYEITQFHRRYTRRNTLCAPEKRCISGHLNDAWIGKH